MKIATTLLVLLAACEAPGQLGIPDDGIPAVHSAGRGSIEVHTEALTSQCFDATVTVPGALGPQDETVIVAAYCAWKGGYIQNHCSGIDTQNVVCTCGNGEQVLVNRLQWGSVLIDAFISPGSPSMGIKEPWNWQVGESGWQGFTTAATAMNPNPHQGQRYGKGSITVTKKGVTTAWKVHHCVVKCTMPAPGC